MFLYEIICVKGLLVLWCLMPLVTTFQLYRWRLDLLMEENGENDRPTTSH
jgi:hypothetical protein